MALRTPSSTDSSPPVSSGRKPSSPWDRAGRRREARPRDRSRRRDGELRAPGVEKEAAEAPPGKTAASAAMMRCEQGARSSSEPWSRARGTVLTLHLAPGSTSRAAVSGVEEEEDDDDDDVLLYCTAGESRPPTESDDVTITA